MQFQKITQTVQNLILTAPRRVWYIAAAIVVVTLYGLTFFTPKQVLFAYSSSETCVRHFALAPDLQKQIGENGFDVRFDRGVTAFGVQIASTQLCVTPTQSPEEGTHSARIALLGGYAVSKEISIEVPKTPRAAITRLNGESISAVRSLAVPVTAKDALHSYSLRVADKSADCTVTADTMLMCDVPALQLSHGSQYDLSMYRTFRADSPTKVGDIAVRTLAAVQLTSSNVAEGQVFYDKPTDFKLLFDKPLKSATIELTRDQGDPLRAETTLSGTEILFKTEQLPRSAQFSLKIKAVEAQDGSALGAPITTTFSTSGGPKVTSVSVGPTSVGQSAQIIVGFDQQLKGDVDIAKFARVAGVNAVVRRVSETQIAYTLQGAPLCAAFSLIIDKGLPSGSNDEASAEAWKFDSRTICGYSATIGSSVQGRAITAYYFGNGSNTLLFTGAIHGSEASSYTTMQAWVEYLQANAHTIPADKRIVVVPNTNPDGVANRTRDNARGVNVDRNFPAANWAKDIESANGVQPGGGGTAAGSEPEAMTLIKLTRQLRPRLSISYHSQGKLVGANKYGDSVAIGAAYASTVGYRTMFDNAEAVMGYAITGEYEEWMGEELGTPAILIELPSHSGNYLNSQLSALKKLMSI